MDEGAGVGVSSRSMTWRLAMLALAAAAWLAGFAILPRLASWTSFAIAGPALTLLALSTDPETRALLRPIADAASQARVRDLVLQAYAEYEETATEAAS